MTPRFHEVFLPSSIHREAVQWCQETLGKRWAVIPFTDQDGLWAVFWAGRDKPLYNRWCFVREEDMVKFILRWS